MKLPKLLTLLLTLSLSNIILADDYGLPSTFKILNGNLSLKENKGDKKAFIAEYIPKEETFENWTSMFAIRFMNGEDRDPKSAAQATAQNIRQRKEKGDILANSMVLEAPDKKSFVVDFLVSDKAFIEHNIWRYFKHKGGLVSYQIARRSYSKDETSEFIKSVKDRRNEFLNEITRKDLPLPEFKDGN